MTHGQRAGQASLLSNDTCAANSLWSEAFSVAMTVPTVSAPASSSIITMLRCNGESLSGGGIHSFFLLFQSFPNAMRFSSPVLLAQDRGQEVQQEQNAKHLLLVTVLPSICSGCNGLCLHSSAVMGPFAMRQLFRQIGMTHSPGDCTDRRARSPGQQPDSRQPTLLIGLQRRLAAPPLVVEPSAAPQ